MIQVVLTFVEGPVEHHDGLWRFDHFTARWLDPSVRGGSRGDARSAPLDPMVHAELKKLRLEVRLS